jgi:hypothetical protein
MVAGEQLRVINNPLAFCTPFYGAKKDAKKIWPLSARKAAMFFYRGILCGG